MQIITVSGRLGGDAETRTVRDNKVTSFNLAVDQGYGENKTTNWFRVSAWGKKGEGAAPWLKKGGVITVVGELEFDTYEGKPQYNIRAQDFTLPPKSGDRQEPRGNGGSGNASKARRSGFDDGFDSDEIPFVRSTDIL